MADDKRVIHLELSGEVDAGDLYERLSDIIVDDILAKSYMPRDEAIAKVSDCAKDYEVVVDTPFELYGNAAYLFAGFNDVRGLDQVDVSGVTDMFGMFKGCSGDGFNPDVSEWDTSNVTEMGSMFCQCCGKSFNPDVSRWNTSKVSGMSSMFFHCGGESFNSDVSSWDMSNVINTALMFEGCSGSRFNPNVSNWDVSNVKDMHQMFYCCRDESFNPDISNWDMSHVENLSAMFMRCGSSFRPDLSCWDVSGAFGSKGVRPDDLNVFNRTYSVDARLMSLDDKSFLIANAAGSTDLLTKHDTVIPVRVDLDSFDGETFIVSWDGDSGYKAGRKFMSLGEIRERADAAVDFKEAHPELGLSGDENDKSVVEALQDLNNTVSNEIRIVSVENGGLDIRN